MTSHQTSHLDRVKRHRKRNLLEVPVIIFNEIRPVPGRVARELIHSMNNVGRRLRRFVIVSLLLASGFSVQPTRAQEISPEPTRTSHLWSTSNPRSQGSPSPSESAPTPADLDVSWR